MRQKPRICIVCDLEFAPTNGNQKYCSVLCKRTHYRKPGNSESTDAQYESISGNWDRYFARLCVKSFRRDHLSKHDCLELLKKQNGKCALSGVELTCLLVRGFICKTNASIDRIDPKGPYVIENVQLVCVALNKLRIDMSIEEFVSWCRRVSEHALRK